MLPSASIGVSPMSPTLIKDFEDKKYQQFSVAPQEYTPSAAPTKRQLKDQQLLAGMAFRFFGLHNMPIYKAETAFLNGNNYPQPQVQATQLQNELQNNNHFANNGRIYCNRISKYKSDLPIDLPDSHIISFSIALQEKEIVLVYNTSKSDAYEKFIMLNRPADKDCSFLGTIYGYDTSSYIQVFQGLFNDIKMSYIRLYLKPLQLIILKNF